MGLDQYAYRTRDERCQGAFDVPEDQDDHELIAQWRKHPNLHGWMRSLYHMKGGQGLAPGGATYMDEPFNAGHGVELTAEDLDGLELAVKEGLLPKTTGFFFGESYGDEEETLKDRAFIAEARDALAQGFRVYYTSWW